jgi:hypothetical protein
MTGQIELAEAAPCHAIAGAIIGELAGHANGQSAPGCLKRRDDWEPAASLIRRRAGGRNRPLRGIPRSRCRRDDRLVAAFALVGNQQASAVHQMLGILFELVNPLALARKSLAPPFLESVESKKNIRRIGRELINVPGQKRFESPLRPECRHVIASQQNVTMRQQLPFGGWWECGHGPFCPIHFSS